MPLDSISEIFAHFRWNPHDFYNLELVDSCIPMLDVYSINKIVFINIFMSVREYSMHSKHMDIKSYIKNRHKWSITLANVLNIQIKQIGIKKSFHL